MDRLGGPPGLFDSPNRDRESCGGIVQRVRVPESKAPEVPFYPGVYQGQSLNDSDSLEDAMGGRPSTQEPTPTAADLEQGVPFKKDITGSNM